MSQALTQQQQHAMELSRTRECPCCGHEVSLLDALCMVRGHGYRFYVRVIAPDGAAVFVDEQDFNPQTMLWGDVPVGRH
jgi:hypothetical protein